MPLAELHCHTQLFTFQRFSRRRLERFLERGRTVGLRFLAITEHAELKTFWNIFAALETRNWQWREMCILAGAEVAVREGVHILLIGTPDALPALGEALGRWPSNRDQPRLADLLAAAEKLEMLRIGAHPLRHGYDVRRVPEDLLRRLDALEINALDLHRSAQVAELAEKLGLPLVGGSDAHLSRHVGRVVNRVPEWVQEIHGLRAAIRDRQTAIVYRRAAAGTIAT